MNTTFRHSVAALAACLISSSALAASTTSPAALRQGPGANWPVLAEVPAGATINFVNCGPGWKNDWCHIKYKGFNGYVLANTLAPNAAGNNVMVAPVVTTDLANMRKGPGSKWPVVGVLNPNTQVNVGQCVNGWQTGWCRVSSEGSSGWVRGALLKRQGALFD